MTRVPLGARDAAWAAGCCAVLLAQFAPADWRPGLPEDSRSAAAGGKKAFALLAGANGYAVSRRERPLTAWEGEVTDPSGAVLAVLGPARDPDDAETEALRDWVLRGGGLLVATRSGASFDFAPYGEIEPGGGGGPAPTVAAGLDAEELRLFWPAAGTVAGAGGILRDEGGDPDELDRAGALVVSGGAVRAARTPVRSGGTTVLVAGDVIFTNRSLAWGDNAALAFRLLERAADGRTRLVIDESLNLTGTPKTVALLLDPELRPLTLHLCLLGVLWGWWRGRGFGPPLPDPDPPRRTLTDHTDAAGDLAWRTGDGAGVVGWYRRAVASDLRIPADPEARRVRAAALARAAGREPGEVEALFARLSAIDAVSEPNGKPTLGRRPAAALIRELAAFRAAAGGGSQ